MVFLLYNLLNYLKRSIVKKKVPKKMQVSFPRTIVLWTWKWTKKLMKIRQTTCRSGANSLIFIKNVCWNLVINRKMSTRTLGYANFVIYVQDFKHFKFKTMKLAKCIKLIHWYCVILTVFYQKGNAINYNFYFRIRLLNGGCLCDVDLSSAPSQRRFPGIFSTDSSCQLFIAMQLPFWYLVYWTFWESLKFHHSVCS